MSMLAILQNKSTAGFKLLAILMYVDLPCMTKMPTGKIIIEDLSEFAKHTGQNSTYVKLYLAVMESMGMVSQVMHRKNYITFFLKKPDFFVYAGSVKEKKLVGLEL